MLVACSGGLPDAPVTCHQVSLRQTLSELSADVQQLPSVYLSCGAQPGSGMQAVVCLRYLHKEDPSQLLVAAAGDGGGVLELWQLGEVPVSFGRIFKRFPGPEPRVQVSRGGEGEVDRAGEGRREGRDWDWFSWWSE